MSHKEYNLAVGDHEFACYTAPPPYVDINNRIVRSLLAARVNALLLLLVEGPHEL